MPNRAARVEELIRNYLSQGKLLQVSTSISNQPWLVHVWYAHDDDLSIYFISSRDRRHSREIREQPQVAGGVVAIQLEGLGQKVRGLTFEGTAIEVDGTNTEQLNSAYKAYEARWPSVKDHVTIDDIVEGLTPVRFYIIQPSLFALFDEVNFPGNARQELTWN